MEWSQSLTVILSIILSIGGMIVGMMLFMTRELKDFHGRLCSLEERHKKNIEEIVKNALERK